MLTKEAIEALNEIFDDSEYSRGVEWYRTAMDMAIKALKQPERKKGRWNITDAYPHNVYCSECYKRYAQTHWSVWEDGSLPRDYCPNCGAKMIEGEQCKKPES